MSDDFFDPPPDEQVVVLVESATLRQAERLIESCEHCNEEDAQIPFDNILDRVTGSDPRRGGLHSGIAGEVSTTVPSRSSGKDLSRTRIGEENSGSFLTRRNAGMDILISKLESKQQFLVVRLL